MNFCSYEQKLRCKGVITFEHITNIMSGKDEAILDAWKQFNTQGVDLSDIDLSGGIGRQEV
jgi:hypothetical protein